MKIVDKEYLEKNCISIKNEKLNHLLQQVREYRKDIYVESVPKIKKTFRWKNPFHPLIEEYDDYVVWRLRPKGEPIHIYHDYKSLKSYFIGFLEGCHLLECWGVPRKKRNPKVNREND